MWMYRMGEAEGGGVISEKRKMSEKIHEWVICVAVGKVWDGGT